MPLDAAKDALIALQGQLIVVLAVRNVEVEARAADLERRLVDENHRINRVERSALPFRHAFHNSVSDRADRLLGTSDLS
jgi:hypothetical protein